ncbi:MAG: DUF4982 domain-containing protein [Bacteroidetes bacterium]|nr:DUF4982 domain-containing protein [Bacteroidota bacterium]
MKIKKQITVILFVLSISSFFQLTNAQDVRKVIDFNKNWLFEQDDWIGYYHGSWMNWDETNWIPVQTPHSFNAEDTFDPEQGYYRGFAWYRKHFHISNLEKGRILKIHFGAIGNESEIWVNEKFMGKFTTGYTPIEIDITEVVNWKIENIIAIRVNNLHNDEIPPGRWRMDYNVYGGIYREVNLLSLSPIHLIETDHFITTPKVSEKLSEISVSTSIKNNFDEDKKVTVKCELSDGNKVLINVSKIFTIPANQSVPIKNILAEIKDIELWSPDNPKLYSLEVSLKENGATIDNLVTKIGFRNFHFDAEKGFFLNGKHLKLRGLNRHQCYPGLANAVPERFQIEDAVLLKELGANYVRCAHYPQHTSFLDACDSLGLLVYEEVASWQHIGGDAFIKHMDYMMDGMIRRDRNHPSIILWGMMNEGHSFKMFEKMYKTAKELDPTRPVSYAENHIDMGIKDVTVFQPDILGLNYNLDNYDKFHEEYPNISILNTECTNADKTKMGDLENQLASTFKIKKDLDFINERDFIAGACIWGFHDYGTEYRPVWPIQTSGVVDKYRNFKEAAYYLKSRWTDQPFVHISGHWNYDGKEGEIQDVYVWNNCDKVDLFLNGKKVIKTRDNLWKIPFQQGELKAIGKKGKIKVEKVLRTAGKAEKVICSTTDNSIKADGFDAILVKAQIIDSNGNPVLLNNKNTTFEIIGPGNLIGIGGKTIVENVNGLANILVRSAGEKGTIFIVAKVDGLESGKIVITAE